MLPVSAVRGGIQSRARYPVPSFRCALETRPDLLEIPTETVIDDICALSGAFLDRFWDDLTITAKLNPTFAGSHDIGGADGDIILNGHLIELKVTKNPR